MHRLWTASTALAVAALALAGCSGGSPGAGPSASRPAAPANSSPSTGAPLSLTAIVLQRSEVPLAYAAEKPAADTPADEAAGAAFAHCVGTKDTDPDQTGDASSDDFTLATEQISSGASRYRSAADVRSDVAATRRPAARRCFDTLFRTGLTDGLPKGATVTSARVTIRYTMRGITHLATVIRARYGVAIRGKRGTAYLMVVLLAAGRTEADLEFFAANETVPEALVTELTTAVDQRVAG